MPRITLQDPFGMACHIDTMQADTLRAWFDESLPKAFCAGRPGIDNFEIVWPTINIWPMSLGPREGSDWLTDSRVLGKVHEFRAKNADEGMAELGRIRAELEAELEKYRQQMGR